MAYAGTFYSLLAFGWHLLGSREGGAAVMAAPPYTPVRLWSATPNHQKPPSVHHGAPQRVLAQQAFQSWLATVLNVVLRLVPTAPNTATAIRPAIRPYSIAVAPSATPPVWSVRWTPSAKRSPWPRSSHG